MKYYMLALGVASVALAAAAPALAQDDDTIWHGFYAGVNAGVVWGDAKSGLEFQQGAGSSIPAVDLPLLNAPISGGGGSDAGFTGGVEAGYNYQMGAFLIGVETDWGFFDINDDKSNTFPSRLLISPPATYTIDHKVSSDWIWTLRPRIGYVSGQWLFFGSAGIGVSSVKIRTNYRDTIGAGHSVSISDSSTKTGFAGGLGIGYALSPNWSVKGEWLYSDFGKVRVSQAIPNTATTVTGEGKVRSNAFLMGVDYRF